MDDIKITENMRSKIISLISDDDIYNFLVMFINDIIDKLKDELIDLARRDDTEDKKIMSLHIINGKLDILDLILYYIKRWRKDIDNLNKKEENNGEKER